MIEEEWLDKKKRKWSDKFVSAIVKHLLVTN